MRRAAPLLTKGALGAAFAVLAALLALASCGRRDAPGEPEPANPPRPIATAEPGEVATRPNSARGDAPEAVEPITRAPFTLVVLGDSLSTGDGLAAGADLPSQVAGSLAVENFNVALRNASVSQETSARALARLDAVLDAETDGLIVQLGMADMRAGEPPDVITANLGRIIAEAQGRGLWVGVIGMRAPLDLDTDVRDEIDVLYFDLADVYDVPLYPYYFDGLIDTELGIARPELFLPGGRYPNEAGVSRVAHGVAAWLADALPAEAMADQARR